MVHAAHREHRPDITDSVTKTLLGDDASIHAVIWDIISGLDLDDQLSEITCPTLVLVGKQDPNTTPAMASHVADALKGSSLTWIPDASHLVTVEAPTTVNTTRLNFLAGSQNYMLAEAFGSRSLSSTLAVSEPSRLSRPTDKY